MEVLAQCRQLLARPRKPRRERVLVKVNPRVLRGRGGSCLAALTIDITAAPAGAPAAAPAPTFALTSAAAPATLGSRRGRLECRFVFACRCCWLLR